MNNMKKELEELEEGTEENIHLESLRTTLKKCQIGKHPVTMAHMDSGLKYLHPSN